MKLRILREYRGEAVFCALMIIGTAGIAIPVSLNTRAENQMRVCQENLTKIDSAKEMWELENCQCAGAEVEVEHLLTPPGYGYLNEYPVCPSGALYVLNPVGKDPVCTSSKPGHSLSEIRDDSFDHDL